MISGRSAEAVHVRSLVNYRFLLFTVLEGSSLHIAAAPLRVPLR